MEPIRLIRERAELQGTCYFELLPGRYRGKSWNEGSVYLAEVVFGLLEPIIARHEPRFDHYSFVAIRRPAWKRIITDLERLAERAASAKKIDDLKGEAGFIFTPTKKDFARKFRRNADALAAIARELAEWLREQLQHHSCVSVLGI